MRCTHGYRERCPGRRYDSGWALPRSHGPRSNVARSTSDSATPAWRRSRRTERSGRSPAPHAVVPRQHHRGRARPTPPLPTVPAEHRIGLRDRRQHADRLAGRLRDERRARAAATPRSATRPRRRTPAPRAAPGGSARPHAGTRRSAGAGPRSDHRPRAPMSSEMAPLPRPADCAAHPIA